MNAKKEQTYLVCSLPSTPACWLHFPIKNNCATLPKEFAVLLTKWRNIHSSSFKNSQTKLSMKNQIIKSLLIAALLAFTSHFAAAQEKNDEIFLCKVLSITMEQITVVALEGPLKNEERTFSLAKNVLVRKGEDITKIEDTKIEEGTTAYLRVDGAGETCLVINVRN